MGEGVSPSLSRYGFSDGVSDGIPTQKRVYPSLTQKWVVAGSFGRVILKGDSPSLTKTESAKVSASSSGSKTDLRRVSISDEVGIGAVGANKRFSTYGSTALPKSAIDLVHGVAVSVDAGDGRSQLPICRSTCSGVIRSVDAGAGVSADRFEDGEGADSTDYSAAAGIVDSEGVVPLIADVCSHRSLRTGVSLPYLLGVSVPFPRENGVCVGSVPFSREQVYFGKSILLDFQAINDTVISVYGLHISSVVSAPYSRELVLFGEISLLMERDFPKEQQRWLIRRSKDVASAGLQISDDVADSGTAASYTVFGGVACCFPAVVCITGAVASDPQGYPLHDLDLSRSEVIKTTGASSVAAAPSVSGVTDSITDAGATEPEDDSPAVALFDAADFGSKQRTKVANNGPIADSDTFNVAKGGLVLGYQISAYNVVTTKIAACIADSGDAVTNIGLYANSGKMLSDLQVSVPGIAVVFPALANEGSDGNGVRPISRAPSPVGSFWKATLEAQFSLFQSGNPYVGLSEFWGHTIGVRRFRRPAYSMPTTASWYSGLCATGTNSKPSVMVVGNSCSLDNVGWIWGALEMLVTMSAGGLRLWLASVRR